MEYDDETQLERHFTILYGSQTGNAQDVAERIARQARRQHIKTSVLSMDEYDISHLIEESLVLFVISTTGNGDFPTAAVPFWRFLLRSDLPKDILGDVTFATFGLGDSSYVRYCWSSRKLNKRLRGLGAQELLEAGEADDQHILGIEGTLRPWLNTLWTHLNDLLPPPSNGRAFLSDTELLPPSISVRLASKRQQNGHAPLPKELEDGWKWASLRKNDRMTKDDHWQDVRLIELAGEDGKELNYRPTDVVSLMPENDPCEVQRLLDRMQWNEIADHPLEFFLEPDASLPFSLEHAKQPTLRSILTTFVDFNSVPRPSFFEKLIPFAAQDHMEREKLQEFCTPGEGADEMYEYAMRVRRTMLEVLEEFGTVQIPLNYVLDVFPVLRRREFSIASSPALHPRCVQLAVAIVTYKTRLKERRRGLCTSWLSNLKIGSKIPISIRPSAMSTAALENHRAPAIFVGPGTGIAPIRSVLLTRHEELQDDRGQSTMRGSENLCVFGCRNQEKDFLFKKEWNSLDQKGCIELHLAASRDQAEKVYVQDRISHHARRVWDILRLGSQSNITSRSNLPIVYICGSSGKMPQAVRAAIVHAAQTFGQLSEEEVCQYIDTLEARGCWIEECWS